ncbi:signal peptidase I [uncultured Jatrophihabitans sp.]|uniref:signal peptidase I n=1 Tax=uncultured Jatrophihabitans sp. TaxID=1610747 RepID=UPI0035CAB690
MPPVAPPSDDLPPEDPPPVGAIPVEPPPPDPPYHGARRVDDRDDGAASPVAAPAAASAAPDAGFLARRRAKRAAEKTAKRAKPRRKAPWWELPALVVLAVLIAIGVKTFVVQPFYIPSQSMEKTLHGCSGCSGDRILVNKPIYDFRDPHPGDIVVFDAPNGWNDEPANRPPSNPVVRAIRGFGQLIGFVPPDGLVLVKRVIASGGQTVKGVAVDGGRGGEVLVSDHGAAGPWKTLNEPYVYLGGDPGSDNDAAARFTFGPVTVPKGRLWVMGDHRDESADSRFHCASEGQEGSPARCNPMSSTVPVDDVIGKAFVIAWPPSRWRTLGTPSTFESAAAPVLPSAVSAGVVVPIFLVRRRRRSTGAPRRWRLRGGGGAAAARRVHRIVVGADRGRGGR